MVGILRDASHAAGAASHSTQLPTETCFKYTRNRLNYVYLTQRGRKRQTTEDPRGTPVEGVTGRTYDRFHEFQRSEQMQRTWKRYTLALERCMFPSRRRWHEKKSCFTVSLEASYCWQLSTSINRFSLRCGENMERDNQDKYVDLLIPNRWREGNDMNTLWEFSLGQKIDWPPILVLRWVHETEFDIWKLTLCLNWYFPSWKFLLNELYSEYIENCEDLAIEITRFNDRSIDN